MNPDSSRRLGSAARRRSENLRLEGDRRAGALICLRAGQCPVDLHDAGLMGEPEATRMMARTATQSDVKYGHGLSDQFDIRAYIAL